MEIIIEVHRLVQYQDSVMAWHHRRMAYFNIVKLIQGEGESEVQIPFLQMSQEEQQAVIDRWELDNKFPLLLPTI